MKILDPVRQAAQAASARSDRPGVAILHDSPAARLVVFRIGPGQQVAPHRSTSTVLLSVVEGSGVILHSDGETPAGAQAVIAFEPNELHGMRADEVPFVVLATITPRPGHSSV